MPTRKSIIPIGPSIAYVPLSQGLYSLIDSDDAAWCEQWNWTAHYRPKCRDYEAVRNIYKSKKEYRRVSLHSQLLGLSGNKITADHINHDGLDNRRCNLRPATHTQQNANHRARRESASGYKGVTRHADGRWRAKICVNKKHIHVGLYMTPEDAYEAYKVSARKHFGEYALLP